MSGEVWPSSIGIDEIELTLNENIASSESILTRYRQAVTLSAGTADRWEGTIRTPRLTPSQVQTMFAFLVKVGRMGLFEVGDPDYTGPASGKANGLVNGAGQTGTSLICDSFGTGTVLYAGEYFQIGDELKMVTADAIASGGNVTFQFKPAIRTSPANNSSVIINSPRLTAYLLTPPSKLTDNLKMGIFNLAFAEAL